MGPGSEKIIIAIAGEAESETRVVKNWRMERRRGGGRMFFLFEHCFVRVEIEECA